MAAKPVSEGFVVESTPHTRLQTIEEVQKHYELMFTGHTIEQLAPQQPFGATVRTMRVGPLSLSDMTYDADVRLGIRNIGSRYLISVPIRTDLQSRRRSFKVATTSQVASVRRPETEAVVNRWKAGSRRLTATFDRAVVDQKVVDVIGRAGSSTLGLAADFDLRTGPGQSWVYLMRALTNQLDDPESVLREPIVALPFIETVIHGFLIVASADYRHALAQPAASLKPVAIRAAVDIIHAQAHEPLTTESIAHRCHVSVRSLQEGFRRHLATTPMAYLRSVRLERAHDELRGADPSRDTVTQIAFRWGFHNLSRFAALYRAAYGESPADTLRSASRFAALVSRPPDRKPRPAGD